jgi:hypothetical protein
MAALKTAFPWWAPALVGALGLAGWCVGLVLNPRHALLAWLSAWAPAAFTAVAALILLASGYAMSARWVAVVRRLHEVVISALPALLVLGLPLALGLGALYPWVHPQSGLGEHARQLFEHKRAWLNTPFFALRSAGYFTVWIGLGLTLNGWSRVRESEARRGERRVEADPLRRERQLSSAALPLLGITATFAAFDWLMSLEPLWVSTMFGLYVATGGMLAAVSLVTLLSYLGQRHGQLSDVLTAEHFHALGRLLLTFVVFWAYCGFFQALLIRIANLPAEVTFFVARQRGGWWWTTQALIFGHFALPFLVLLVRSWKRRPAAMGAVAAWLLLMCALDGFWLVMPELEGHRGFPDGYELAALLAVLGCATAFAAWRQQGRSLLAQGDPFLTAGLAYRSKW